MLVVDYKKPREFHAWYQFQLKGKASPLDVIQTLATDHSPWSLCRQMCIAHWSDVRTMRDDLTEAALYSSDPLVEAYAVSLDAYREVAKFNTSTEGYNSLAYQYLPMLEGYIRKILNGEPTALVREVEASLRSVCGLIHFDLGNTDRATEECSHAIYWLKKIGANFLLSKCRSLFVTVKGSCGQLDEAIATILEERTNLSRATASIPFQERAYAEMLFYLGHNELPLSLLYKLEAETENNNKRSIQNTIQRTKCFLGKGNGSEEIDERYRHDPRGWLVQSLGNLVKHSSLPVTSQTREQREALLHAAIKVWKDNPHQEYPWLTAWGQWITSLANLWLSKTTSSLTALHAIKPDISQTQWLDLRILKAGLGIELALHLNNPELKLHPFINEFQQVLADAERINMASKKGLLERFLHWHPVAAAFTAVMPDGIVELQDATRAIMQVGYRNVVHGISLPPAYMVELILRSLDLDRIPAYRFTQSDPGSGRIRRNQLIRQYGDVNYWLPTISAIRLIYGLKKLGYSETALKISNEYGLLPHSNAEYAMMPVLEHIGELTRRLLLDELSVSDFAKEIVAPD
jgi:hypothetical protein